MRLLCIVPGSKPFSVNIDNDKMVDELKKKVKEAKAPQLDTFAADALTLYVRAHSRLFSVTIT